MKLEDSIFIERVSFDDLDETEKVSAITKPSYDYTQWRHEYFENAYKTENASQLENFLDSAAEHDPIGTSSGINSG
jgi:hypothetical protein